MEEYVDDLEKNLEALEMEVDTLNAMINELLKRVSKDKDRGLQTLPAVEKWMSRAEKIESKASSLLDESISLMSPATLHYCRTVCMTLKEVKALRSEGVFKELVERVLLSHVKKMLPLQPIVSREMLLEKAWKCLTESECQTLGLYGVAGVGKTTLLTQIKNKFIEGGDASTLVLFVVVESEEDIEGIQVTIMKRLGIYGRLRTQQEKASDINKSLNRKRFVLLLDGVRMEGVDLAGIGVPQPSGENGCKIVFTTRFQEACRSMFVDTELEVKCLSPEEAWDMFQEIVGETTLKSHPDIPQLARIVARKCGGLPIALSLIGKTMSGKRTVREWHHAIHVLVSSTAEFSSMEAEVLPILKLTYDNLPGKNIKSCFLYCALLPKKCDIRKEDLVDYWIGEGIIAKEEDREIAEIQGYQMMDDLVSVRLLMEDESGYLVKMHGMVREMALWIASDFGKNKENFVVVGGVGIHQMPMVNDWRIVRRMSVTSTQIEKISGSPDCPKLTTLFLQDNNLKWITGEFFRWMTSLVVLNLSHNRKLSELPQDISSLVSLRLLNLSWTLIKRLPLGLKELKRLIHLDLDDTPFLRDIDVIGYLLNLQVLRLSRSVPMDLSLMEDVQLLKSLKDLSLTVKDVDVLKSIHQLASCIQHLHLRGITITDGGILLLNSMLCLRELNIWMCDIPQITIQKEALHSGNIEKFPLLQNIRTVTLYRCTSIRDLTWLLLAPNLGDLSLHECQQIEQIINQDKATADTSEQPFQNLTMLRLSSLPKLESIYWAPLHFPVLEYLYIRACPKLTRRPFNSDITKGNQVLVDLDQEWIEGVEWEDEATKQHFSNFANDRDFLKMAEDQKMDGLASASHRIKDIVMVETTESGKSTTANSITKEKVVQYIQTYNVLKPDGMISNMDTPGNISKGPQVFISFRGEELRRSFVSFLTSALRAANINVFTDEDELLGTSIQDLLVGIEQSRVALAIFSKEYTTSEWCLDELVKIKECMDKGSLIGTIPIFYKLQTSVVRNLGGQFGDNFRDLKRKNRHDLVKTKRWEEALKSIRQTKGMNFSEERNEAELIRSVVKKVKILLDSIPMGGKTDQKQRDVNSQCYMIYARKIEITHSDKPEIWTWSSIYEPPNEVSIEVAKLNEVYWLDISGTFHTRKLTPETKYEVVFVVKLEETASGWEEPVNLSLKLIMRDKTEIILQEQTLYWDDYITEEWVDIKAGEFVAPPNDTPGKILFTMYQYDDTVRKTGLVVKGVAIRAVNEDAEGACG